MNRNGFSSIPDRIPQQEASYRRWLLLLLIGIGIVLRLVLFLQNRNLIIDEANVVRNLYERSYAGLLRPLSYQQFAPPGFLWIEKAMTQCFGFGEKAVRLFPLLCGIGSLIVFQRLLARFLPLRSYWFPLTVLAVGNIYVEYSTVAKPYASDVLIGLLLLYSSLSFSGRPTRKRAIAWLLSGIIAIWFSMPTIFVLAATGCAALLQAFRTRSYRRLPLIGLAGTLWSASFGLYYYLLLRHQVNNSVLQQFHEAYFLYLLPHKSGEWSHNGERLLAVVGVTAGYTGVAMTCSLLLLATGVGALMHRQKFLLLLLTGPVLLLLLAAALHRFTLIERVILFALPLLLVVMGCGLEKLLEMLWPRWLKGLVQLLALATVCSYGMFRIVVKKYGLYELTEGLTYVQQHAGAQDAFCLHHGIRDAFVYYTTIHPDRQRWRSLPPAVCPEWDADYSHLVPRDKSVVYFLYTGIDQQELAERHRQWLVQRRQTDFFERYQCRVERWSLR